MKKKDIKGYIYILPALVILLTFKIYPILKSFLMAFYTDFDYLTGEVFEVGFSNFEYVLTDPDFYMALKNTFYFVLISVPLGIVISLWFAILLNSKIKFQSFFRSVYFLPFITSTVALSIVWRWILNGDYGLLNHLVVKLGGSKVKWLLEPKYTILILSVFNVWKGMGYKIIIFLAGLQNIDKKYYLSAQIDGASRWDMFTNITLPLLTPTLFFVLITSMIGAFKIFGIVYNLYNQSTGPLKSGLTIVYYIFNKFYRHWQFSIASAASVLLFLIILIFTLIQLKVSKKKTNY